MRTLIIGDIHGCWDEFQDLLDHAGLSDTDQIVSVGDMVDRGPAPARVLTYFQNSPNTSSLMGNHEYKHVRILRGELQPSTSQEIARKQFGEGLYQDAVAFMATLPTYLCLPEVDVVHGFFEPGVPLEAQRISVIVGTTSGENYLNEHYNRIWYELYDGEKPLVVGHRNYTGSKNPLVYPAHGTPKVFALDTGCVYGRALTGLLLPEFNLITVPARSNHWAAVKQRYGYLNE